MSSDLEAFLEIAQYVSTMLEIYEFNQTWEKSYQMHQKQVRKYIQASYNYYVEFLEFLLFFHRTCIRTRFSLTNIKLQFEIAKEEMELDEPTLLEMQYSSVRLSDSFKALHKQTRRTKYDLVKFKKNLRDRKEFIQEERCGQYSSVIVQSLAAIVRGSLSMMSISDAPTGGGFLLLSGGAIVVRMVTQNQKNAKMTRMNRLSDTVDDVQRKVVPLYTSVDECSQEIQDMRNQLDMFLESVKLNVRFEPDTDAKIKIRSNGMIVAIDELVRELKRVEVFIKDATYRLRREIREVNPEGLTNI